MSEKSDDRAKTTMHNKTENWLMGDNQTIFSFNDIQQ